MNQVTVKSVSAGFGITRYVVVNALGEKIRSFAIRDEAEAYAEKLREASDE